MQILRRPAQELNSVNDWAKYFLLNNIKIIAANGKVRIHKGVISTADQFKQFYSTSSSSSYGIHCGANSLAILDIDERGILKEIGYMPHTWTVRTPGGGLHYFFRLPADSENIKTIKIPSPAGSERASLRVGDWYVIGPGCGHELTHVLGSQEGVYRFVEGCEPWSGPLAEIPQELIAQLKKLKQKYSRDKKAERVKKTPSNIRSKPPIIKKVTNSKGLLLVTNLLCSYERDFGLNFDYLTAALKIAQEIKPGIIRPGANVDGLKDGSQIPCFLCSASDENPSLRLFRGYDGNLLFHDFHTDKTVTAGGAIFKHLFGPKPFINTKLREYKVHIYKHLNALITDQKASGGYWLNLKRTQVMINKLSLPEDEKWELKRVIMAAGLLGADYIIDPKRDQGFYLKTDIFRYLTGLRKKSDMNRAINFLCCIGFLKKKPNKSDSEKQCDILQLNLEFSSKLESYKAALNIKSYRSLGAVQARAYFGDAIFAIYRVTKAGTRDVKAERMNYIAQCRKHIKQKRLKKTNSSPLPPKNSRNKTNKLASINHHFDNSVPSEYYKAKTAVLNFNDNLTWTGEENSAVSLPQIKLSG